MTEDEAKTKWCPFARSRLIRWDKASASASRAGEIVNVLWSDGDQPPSLLCIASACMAWRTKTSRETNRWNDFVDVTTGYCGLAGAPQ